MAQHGASEQGSERTQHRHRNARAAASKGHSLVVSMELGRPLWLGLEVAWPWLADSADSAPGPLSASEEARLLVPTECWPKGANTVLIACRRVAVASQCMAPATKQIHGVTKGREGKAGRAWQGRQARHGRQASKAPRLQPSESADCDPAQAARSLNNRPSSLPRPSQTRGYGGARTGATCIAAAGLTAKEQFSANRICLKFLKKNSLGGRLLICGSPPSRGLSRRKCLAISDLRRYWQLYIKEIYLKSVGISRGKPALEFASPLALQHLLSISGTPQTLKFPV
jgi:hypothetical protein